MEDWPDLEPFLLSDTTEVRLDKLRIHTNQLQLENKELRQRLAVLEETSVVLSTRVIHLANVASQGRASGRAP